MGKYELTDRGKIAITVVIAVVLLLLSAILLFRAMAAKAAQSVDKQGTEPSGASPPDLIVPEPQESINIPPPNGGGLSPTDDSPVIDVDIPEGQDPAQTYTPDHAGQATDDPFEGMLSFEFTPDQQNILDPEDISTIEMFLSSPLNTQDSVIMIEMPQLPEDDTDKLMETYISAFLELGVSEERLAFSILPSDPANGVNMVSIHYIIQPGK